MPKWEYEVLKVDRRHDASFLTSKIDEFGRDGWELVTVTYDHHAEHEETLVLWFKRVLECGALGAFPGAYDE